MQKANPKKPIRKSKEQSRPGNEYEMNPVAVSDDKKVSSACYCFLHVTIHII